MHAATRTVLGLGATGLGVLGWASLIERNAFVVRRFTVPVLPAGAATLRVLHVSDLHLVPRQKRKAAWVRSLASLDPDLVINTGDNLAAEDAVPAVLDAFAADGARLIIAGHTHGGQVCVPGYGALVTNCDLDTGRVKGLSRWWPGAGSTPSSAAPPDAAWLEVSAGLGTSPTAPVRLACRPEATLLTLVPAGDAPG